MSDELEKLKQLLREVEDVGEDTDGHHNGMRFNNRNKLPVDPDMEDFDNAVTVWRLELRKNIDKDEFIELFEQRFGCPVTDKHAFLRKYY
jgi:hypothetical protein